MSETATAPAVAPVAPAAPAAAAPPERQSFAEVIEAAKAAQAVASSHHSLSQPRVDGKFAGAPNPLLGGEPAPLAEPDPTGEVAPEQPEQPEDAYVPFVLPGHAERGEADIVLEFPDTPEVQERLKRLANDGMRKKDYDQAMQTVEQQRQQVEAFETRVQLDPAGFVAEYVPREMLKPLILAQLANDDTLLDELRDDLSVLDDPQQRRRVASEARLALLESRDSVQSTLALRAENRATTQAVSTALQALVPDTLNDAQREQWVEDSLTQLATMVRNGQLDRRQVTAHNLPAVLGARLQAWGVNDAAVRIAQALNPTTMAPSAPRVAAPALPPATRPGAVAPATPASRTVADLKATNAARAAVAQTGGPAAGAPLANSVPAFTGPGALERTLRAAKQRSGTLG